MRASLGSVEYITSLYQCEDELRKIQEAVHTSSYGKDFVHAALSVNDKKVIAFSLYTRKIMLVLLENYF